MADEFSLPHEPAFAVPDDEFRVTEYRPRPANRDSASTSKSRRESYYDSQRGPDAPARRSRPTSTASVLTTRSRGKQRASHHDEPMDYENLDGTAYPHPVPSQDNRQTLEDVPPQTQADGAGAGGMHVRNFSRISARRKTNETDREGLNFVEVSALPPIPNSNRLSAATTARPTTQPSKRSEDRGNDPDNAGLPRPFSQTQPGEHSTPIVDPVPKWLTEVYTISYLVFFAIFGTLARLGVQWITFYPGAPIATPVVWANMAGSWMMGFLSEDQSLFRDHARSTPPQTDKKVKSNQQQSTLDKIEMNKRKKAIPLYIGLATGFCGSFTSFSSFARDFFLALSNDLPAPIYHSASLAASDSPSSTIGRHAGYSFEALFGVILSTLALSIGGYTVGAHTALAFQSITPSLPATFVRKVLDPLFVFLACGCWAGAVIMAALPPDPSWRGEVLFALVFAPLGALTRFYVSRHMNGLIAWFPLGTFGVNMLGTAIEGMCYDIQHVPISSLGGAVGGGRLGCQVLQGVQDGFCGCLTTVSTWVAEVVGLKRRQGYFYAVASVGGGLALMVVIMGSVRWSVGFDQPVCRTGYTSKVGG